MESTLSNIFPNVESITIKVIDTNAWHWNRLKEWEYLPHNAVSFHIPCPMSKCIGDKRGIYYGDIIYNMIRSKETHRQVELACVGYGGYNKSFHCDFKVTLGITLKYPTLEND